MQTKKEVLAYLHDLDLRGMDLQLDRMNKVMSLLEHPEQAYPCIHIAGTNGKGSTASFLSHVLAEKYKVGLYTSPFVIDFNERMQINNKPLSDEHLVNVIREVKERTEHLHPTRFEVMTAAAFLYFKQQKVDIAIIEVGLGGRFDATNVITPEVSIITNIGLDHQEMLGETKEEIAREKAGIIKENIPVVTGETNPALLKIFKEYTDKLIESSLPKIHHASLKEQVFEYKENVFTITLPGTHQVHNASIALTALESIHHKMPTTIAERKTGLEKTTWPGRMQVLEEQPLIIVDGAHNREGMSRLCETIKNIPKKKIVVLGLKQGKAAKDMIAMITPLVDEIITTEGNFKPLPAEQIANMIPHATPISRPLKAFAEAKRRATVDDMIIVAGSLYLAGDILKGVQQNINSTS